MGGNYCCAQNAVEIILQAGDASLLSGFGFGEPAATQFFCGNA
jgi:hypothetical protein